MDKLISTNIYLNYLEYVNINIIVKDIYIYRKIYVESK